MRLKLLALAPLIPFLALSACGKERVLVPLPIPPERMDCVSLIDDRPTIPPEYVIDWTRVTTVGQARAEHQAFVTRLRERETPVTVYIVEVEAELFACADDAAWLRDYSERLPAPE